MRKICEFVKKKIHNLLFPPVDKWFLSVGIAEEIPSLEEIEECRKMLEEYKKRTQK